jgi:hypothetical protein
MYEYIPNFRQIGSKVEMEKETYTMISWDYCSLKEAK